MKITLTFMFYAFLTLTTNGQNNSFSNLLNATKSECRTNLAPHNIDCETIDEKFNSANIYLALKLTQLVLTDSSTLYNEKIKELENLENRLITNRADSIKLKLDKEKLYLLISLLKPQKSFLTFSKLIQSYYNISTPITIPKNSASFYYYKDWLYELLKSRFPEEKAFANMQLLNSFNKSFDSLGIDFKDIETEKKIIAEADSLFQKVKNAGLTVDKYSDFMTEILNYRALKITKSITKTSSDSVYKFIEYLYKRALSFDKNSLKTNYNFGSFYYNQAVEIIDSMSENDSEEKMEIQQKKSAMLLKKSKPYLKIYDRLNKNKTSTNTVFKEN